MPKFGSAAASLRAGRIPELIGQASPPPPPPPPKPAPPSVAPQTALREQWDRRIHDYTKRSGALPPPEEGNTRLYRAGKLPSDSAWSLDDMMDGPFGQRMTRRQFEALKDEGTGGTHPNPFGASGRWFTDAPEELDFYVRENDTDPIYYLDVPSAALPSLNVAGTPYTKNSRNHAREFIVPDEHIGRAVRLLDGLRSR
jgi:hypothetical protein